MSQAENPDRLRPGREVTVDDVRQLMGASTPHFALQLRERIRKLIRDLPAGHPARVEGEREIARLRELGLLGEFRGDPHEDGLEPLPSLSTDGPGPSAVPLGKTADQLADPLSQLQREVRGRRAHQLPHVLDRGLVVGLQAFWVLGLAHFCGTASRRLSICA